MNRRSRIALPMSDVGSDCSGAVTRNRSATVPIDRELIASHTLGRHATTAAVRRMLCLIDIKPCATCSRSRLSVTPPEVAVRSVDCASKVSI